MDRSAYRAVAGTILLATTLSGRSQITTATGFTPAYIVQNVLLGPGVSASNFVFNGGADQLGTFDCVNCNVGIPTGMVMCTGSVNQVVGPNNDGGFTLGGGNWGVNDPDLDVIAGPNGTNDRAALEFDFVPTGDSIKFNFVFASEEYLEYVNSINDVFGFFLSGPGIAGPYTGGAANIALVPGTAMAVSINNVNNVVNSAYYVDNGDGSTPPFNIDPYYIQYDGFTAVLTAQAQVVCGQTYHIKLVIADYSDTILDSGVFIEAGSFQSNQIAITSDVISGGVDSVLYEGCGHTTLVFVRAGDVSDSLQVDLVETGAASNGVDHTLLPGTVYFLPGQDSLLIDLEVFLDGLTEGLEQVILTATYDNGCSVGTSDIVFYLDDAPPIALTINNDTTLICNDSLFIQATATGGFGNLHYAWNTGVADSTLSGWVSPASTTTYVLTVTDDCGVVTATADVTITIPVPAPLLVQAVPDTVVFCPESPVQLQAVVSGGTPGYVFQWSNGLGGSASASVSPPTTQSYLLTVTDACGVDTTDQVTVTVQYDSVEVFITPDTTICRGDAITLTAWPTAGWNGYTLLWDDGSTSADRQVSPSSGTTYTVTATDGCGISATDQAVVGVNAPIAAFTYSGSVFVENFPISFHDQSTGAIGWSWDFDHPGLTSEEQHPVITFPANGLFNVMLAVVDPLGCVDTTYLAVEIEQEFLFYAPNTFTPDGDGRNDRFFGSGVGMDGYRMRIFDRWGELIFESGDLHGAWDGTTGGEPAPVGVYAHQFRLHSISGRVAEFTGHITLLR